MSRGSLNPKPPSKVPPKTESPSPMKTPMKKMPMMPMKKMKMKSLGAMKNRMKGEVHHAEIHPAKNSNGSRAYLSTLHRDRSPAAQAAMDAGGNYTAAPPPEETQHPNYADAMNHVGKAFGEPPMPAAGEPDGDEEPEDEGE